MFNDAHSGCSNAIILLWLKTTLLLTGSPLLARKALWFVGNHGPAQCIAEVQIVQKCLYPSLSVRPGESY